jgi:hypothetical protein
MSRVGGQSPDAYGLSITVNVPAATSAAPVKYNYPLKWDDTAPFSAALCADGDVVELIAKHTVEDAITPLGAWVPGGNSRVHVLNYTGTAPAIGSAIVANGQGGVRAVDTVGGETGSGQVLYVDTSRNTVEVLV